MCYIITINNHYALHLCSSSFCSSNCFQTREYFLDNNKDQNSQLKDCTRAHMVNLEFDWFSLFTFWWLWYISLTCLCLPKDVRSLFKDRICEIKSNQQPGLPSILSGQYIYKNSLKTIAIHVVGYCWKMLKQDNVMWYKTVLWWYIPKIV